MSFISQIYLYKKAQNGHNFDGGSDWNYRYLGQKWRGCKYINNNSFIYITSLLAQAHKHLLICFIYRFTRTLNNIFGPQYIFGSWSLFLPIHLCIVFKRQEKKTLRDWEIWNKCDRFFYFFLSFHHHHHYW